MDIYENNEKIAAARVLDTGTLKTLNHLDSGVVIRAWDREICFLDGLRFEPCDCSYDGHWRLTWSLTSGSVGLVEVRTNWPEHPR
jgi:hypothetical protein